MSRLQSLREKLAQAGLEGILIGSAANRRYMSGFTGSDGWLIISNSSAVIAVDFRYVEQARLESSDFELFHVKGDITSWLPGLVKGQCIQKLGIEADHMPVSVYQAICKVMQAGDNPVQILSSNHLVEPLRMTKDAAEMEYIKKACDIADGAIAFAAESLRPGISEKQFTLEIESYIRRHDSESLPFEIIAASGPNSALPHARPTDRIIGEGEPVTLDLGARYRGYCSDITRTFVTGKASDEFYKIYNAVLTAQLTALSVIKSEMTGAVADKLIRDMIDKMGYGEMFGHGLGHGVGLETHERPRLGMRSEDILTEGMVFTIEPGIYLPGWGGVRIEDTVTILEGNVVPLTRAGKEALVGRL